MHFSTLSALAALTVGGLAAPSNIARHVLHERRDETPTWVKVSHAGGDRVLPMRIGLTQSNLDVGPDLLLEVSNPSSSKYGQHYSAQEIQDLFAPRPETVAAVRAWLQSSGIDPERVSHSANKQWLQFDANVDEAEELLKTQYHVYEHTFTGQQALGCDEYHIHEDVKRHIDYITPGVKTVALKAAAGWKTKRNFMGPNGWVGPIRKPMPAPLTPQVLAANPLANCDQAITPPCIRAMYNFTPATSAQKGNQLGIFEDGDYYDQADLTSFFKAYATNIPSGTHPTLNSVDGGQAPQGNGYDGGESLLDFELSYPIIWPQNVTLYQTDDNYYAEGGGQQYTGYFNTFLDAIDGSYCNFSAFGEKGNSAIDPVYPDPNDGGYKGQLMCGVYKPTNVISLSYGLSENGAGIPSNYQQRQCAEYMKLGLAGHTIVFASGDQGVGSNYGCLGTNQNVFSPDFPSNCPWVTSAGSVYLPPGSSAAKDQEVATTSFPSGGGFSNVFAQPSYQSSAVAGFFKSPGAPKYPYYSGSTMGNGIYNRSGRGYPDISAVGDNIALYVGGGPTMEGGTSASAPTFASILTRINDARLAAGKSVIGFVNPTLYKNPSAFHDITVGTNPNCNSNGFNATIGWDPVTGLGTPNYPSLLKVFMALP